VPPILSAPFSRSRLRLAPAAVVLGVAALLAVVLWAGRSGSPGKATALTPGPTAPSGATPPPPAASTPAGLPPGTSPAQPVDRPEPVYPEQAAGTGLAVHVTVDLAIDDRGRVIKADAPFVDAEKPIPWELYRPFKNAALKAARALHFQPASRYGAPIRDQVRLVIEVRPP
jgi:outer membrane biosynthesis protein TonB